MSLQGGNFEIRLIWVLCLTKYYLCLSQHRRGLEKPIAEFSSYKHSFGKIKATVSFLIDPL